MKQLIFLVGLISLFSLSGAVFAAEEKNPEGPITRKGETISIDTAQSLSGDFYGFSPTITISGPAEHDVYLVGGDITLNAPVAGDLVVLGGVVDVHGEVKDDVRVIGGEVKIASHVHGDVVVLAGTLEILPTAVIDGDILFQAGTVRVNGPVTGTVHGTAEDVRINTTIGGDVLVTVHTALVLGDNAEVSGDITYESANDLTRAQDAIVVGAIHKTKIAAMSVLDQVRFTLQLVCIVLFATLTWYLLFRSRAEELCTTAYTHVAYNGIVGLGIFVGLPFVALLLLFSQIGMIVGLTLFLVYGAFLLAGCALIPMLFGYLIQKMFGKDTTIRIYTLLVGGVASFLIASIPFFGGFLLFTALMIMIGTIGNLVYRAMRTED